MADIRVEKDGPVTIVTMSRPERRNAVDGPMAAELERAFADFEDSDSSVAVLTGEGAAFCAGADLKAVNTDRSIRLAADGAGPMGPTRMRLSKPVIAAIHGHAVAGGLELALWCDLRVADRSAVLGVFCRRWGVPLIDGGTVRLPRLIGQSRAMDLILTGRPVEAQEAFDIGLVNRLVEDGQSLAEAIALAHQLAALPQACLRGDRASALSQWGKEQGDAMADKFAAGLTSLRLDGRAGAERFARGAGRHGSFED